ncbi:LysR family transcriptional regulator [Pseudomonas sp. Marseille-QA0892]
MISLNPRALACLSEVVHFGSLRRAAQHMNVDPSSVSRQISALEEEIGHRLLERSSSGARPTAAGKLLIEHYKQQLSSQAATLSRLGALSDLSEGEVRIAVGEGFIADLIAQPLQEFLRAHPGIELEVRMAGANEAVGLIKDDSVDFAFIYSPPEDYQLLVHADTAQPMELITPPDHPLLESDAPVQLAELEGYPFAMIRNSTGMGQLMRIAARLERIELKPRLRTNSVAVLINFVKSGIGVTFMPKLTVMRDIEQGHICARPAAASALSGARARIVSHRNRELSLASMKCLTYLRRATRFFNGDAPLVLRCTHHSAD